MTLTVREMMASEVDVIIEYFQSSTPERLETLSVDPTRLPPVESWRERLRRECALPIDQRSVVLVIWLSGDWPIGFSTSGKIFCEPNAFNVAPNRTLQKAGFKYLKTHKIVPGPLNFHQAVTRWMIER
jgi:hypothetical protein